MGRAYEVRKASMAKTAAAKTKVYARYGKEIYLAAKNGLPDPEMNQTLKRTIDKAKANQVPAEVINRAIDKAKGNDDAHYESIRYEGFGAEAATIIVDCLTDNVNRTISEVRNCFTKTQGKLGVSGSVAFGYDHLGILSFTYENEDAVLECLLNAEVDVTDIEKDDHEITVYVNPTDLYKAKDALEELAIFDYQVLEISMLPQEYVKIKDPANLANFEKLLAMLDEVDDVQQVYHNVIVTE